MTTTTLTKVGYPNEPLPMNKAEKHFYDLAKLEHEDDLDARLEAFAMAGAENLGFQSAAIFEWETVFNDGIQCDRLQVLLDGKVIHSAIWFADFSDEERRTVEANTIRYELTERLLAEIA